MGRTIRFNDAANRFTQGGSVQNTEVTLFMKGGKDIVILNRTDDFGGNNRVDAGAGNDAVHNLKEQGNIILLGKGNDTYAGEGFGSFSTDRGDTVRGGDGNDTIAVSTFKSTYTGDKGNDLFISVGWQNTFIGGNGSDTISYEARDHDTSLRGSGLTIDLQAGKVQTGANRVEFVRQIENVIGTIGNDAIFGQSGANRLTGGEGFDQLTGRGGADTFVWRSHTEARVASNNIDIVMDFNRAQGDKIDLRGIDADPTRAGDQAFTFIGDKAFTGAKGQLRFSDEILEGDRNGDGVMDFRIGLLGIDSMVARDILL
ncbi:calcium-binding protein [Gemmobacter serpentinus]|uniref:calcium-binding protein n=1 Tax=Gemmobacter serpentinus TaxID=2652247 RepID=UPI001865768B|nr:calcium-binding protein [Gemmobacter serpentinus]